MTSLLDFIPLNLCYLYCHLLLEHNKQICDGNYVCVIGSDVTQFTE